MDSEGNIHQSHRHRLIYTFCIGTLLISIVSAFVSMAAIDKANEPIYSWDVSGQGRGTGTLCDDLDSLSDRILSNEIIIDRLQDEVLYRGYVSLTEGGWQRVDETFLFSDAAVTQHLTGVKVSGRIVNTSSVIHSNIRFKISMSGGTNTFTISRVSPANSTAFTVYVPEVTIENSESAWITYVNSSCRFAR